jgi:glycosyltransferase involved in cell wall biosynthesis
MPSKNKPVVDSVQVNQIKVSICCVTFNHETYIRKCLEGFVMQQTDFGFEVIVHDDASTDGTADIVREFESKYPHLFRCIYQTENQFLKQNVLFNLMVPASKGIYIALCEGDDYWTDIHKLQAQVDLFSANSELSMVCTNAQKLFRGELIPFYHIPIPELFCLEQFILGQYKIATCTVLIKTHIMTNVAELTLKHRTEFFHMDYLIWCLAGSVGSIACIDRQTAVYRVHQLSIMRTTNRRTTLRKGMHMNVFLAKHLGSQFRKHFLGNNWWYYLEYAFVEIEERKFFNSFLSLCRALFESIIWRKSNQLQIFRDYAYRLRNRKTLTN